MVAVEVEKLGSIDNSYPGIFLEIIHQKPYIIHKHGLGRNVVMWTFLVGEADKTSW